MPLKPRHDGCAKIVRARWPVGRQLRPTADVRAVWRFEPPDGPQRILLCDQHAVEFADYERLTLNH